MQRELHETRLNEVREREKKIIHLTARNINHTVRVQVYWCGCPTFAEYRAKAHAQLYIRMVNCIVRQMTLYRSTNQPPL